MKVINDGKGITVEASYSEIALIVEALRKGAGVYEQEGAIEHAEETRKLIDEMINKQEVI